MQSHSWSVHRRRGGAAPACFRRRSQIANRKSQTSFALRYCDGLTIAQGPLADENHLLLWLQTARDLHLCPIIETRLHAGLFGLVFCQEENRSAGLLGNQRIDGNQESVFLAFNADFDNGIHPRPELQLWVWQLDFDQHGFAGLVERIGEASHFAFETAPWEPINGQLDRLISC